MDEQELQIQLSCRVCGEKQFNLREGFYYCEECGTKQNQIQDIEIESVTDYNDFKFLKKQKIKTVAKSKPELTSWECYNYILRGIVEELLLLGAKTELKLMSLQIWAAYLRRSEVAFFSKKAQLPKLGIRYRKRDSEVLYNHSQRLKKRKRSCGEHNSIKSGESPSRFWRKNKRKLVESIYSNTTASQSFLSKETRSYISHYTSSTGNTTRAIQLEFSSSARKQFKRIMPIKHLKKHELDSTGELTCHKIFPIARTMHKYQRDIITLNIKKIYAIIAIALNLIEDDIQLCDLMRYINEERISINNVSQYFPENIAPHCKEILREIGFPMALNKYTYKPLRDQILTLSKFVCIKNFHEPNMPLLVKRYVLELNLPDEVAVFVERLINLIPPKFNTRAPFVYPAYEARAMAYIIFVLKLLFGLDGHKETLISQSAHNLNLNIDELKETEDEQKILFVWSEWMIFVEMRKIILSQYNHDFSQILNTSQLLFMMEELKRQQEEFPETMAKQEKLGSYAAVGLKNMEHILKMFLSNYNKTSPDPVDSIFFPPSFTPTHSYLKRILLHVSIGGREGAGTASVATATIPDFMRTDHTQRTVRAYLQPKGLREFFAKKKMPLKVSKAPCTSQRNYIGIFRQAPNHVSKFNSMKADFAISEKKWRTFIEDAAQPDDLHFKTNLEGYEKQYLKKMRKKRKTDIANTSILPESDNTTNICPDDFLLPSAEFCKKMNAREDNDICSMYSIDVFKEDNMEPIENFNIEVPRRHCDNNQLFENVSSGAESSDDSEEIMSGISESLTQKLLKSTVNGNSFITTNLDYWILMGNIAPLNEVQKKILMSKFPRSFLWLLETCAQTIDIDWSLIYEQLLVIEIMLLHGIESLEDIQGYIKFKPFLEIKDINQLLISIRDIW